MKKIDKIIKNTILGGNMKKILFLAFLMSLSLGLFAAPAISTIGMSNADGGGTNTNTIQAGETIYISGTATDVTSGYQLQGVYNGDSGTTVEGELYVTYWNQTPNSNYTGATYGPSITTSFTGSGVGGTTFTGSFTLPSTDIPTDTQYITIYTGIFEKKRAAKNYSSVGETDFDFTTAPTGYYTRLDFYADTTTEAPTANSWSQTSATEITINYNLPEDGKSNSVRVYFSEDNTIGSDRTYLSITGHDSYNSGNAHSVTLTYPFTTDDSDVSSLNSSESTLVNGTSYYLIVSYDDSSENGYASDATDGTVTFDGETLAFTEQPTFADATNDDDVTISYNLPEEASVCYVYFKYTTSAKATATKAKLTMNTLSAGATGNLTLNADNLSSSSSVTTYDETYDNALTEDTSYWIEVEYSDTVGNVAVTSDPSSSATYTKDSETTQPTMDSASQNAGDHEFTFQFDLPEDALDNSVKIFIDTADDHDGSEGQIQLAGTFSAGNDQTVTLSLDTSTNKFDTNDGDIDSIANDTALTNGTTYYVSISYQDASGNTVAISSETVTFAPDLLTDDFETSDFSAPSTNENATINLTFNLDETAKADEVHLYIDDDNDGTADGAYELSSSFETSGSHDVDFDGTDLTTSNSYIDQVETDPGYNNLTTGNTYAFRIGYKDSYGNAEQTSDWRSFTYDTDAPTISSVNITDESSDSIYLDYTLSEQALDNKVIATIKNSDGTSTISVVEMIGASISSGATHNDVELHGDALGTNGGDYTCTVTSGANSLDTGTTYRIYLSMTDEAGNASSTSVYDSFDYLYDSGTESPTMSSASELADANGPKLRVSYNLPEDGTNETVKILVCNTDDATDVHSTITLEGYYSAGDSGNIDLDLPFSTDDSDVYAVSGTTTLTDGTTYYTFVQYQDAAGNTAATSSASKSFTWDGATQSPTLTLPENNGSDNASLTINVRFPENDPAPYTGSMKLYITEHTTRASATLVLQSITSEANFVINGANLDVDNQGTNNVASASGALEELTNGHQYDVYFGYRDDWGNAEATSGTNTFTYDTSASTISISSPANNTTVTGNFDLVYTKSEAARNGTFKIMFDNSTDGNDATLTMNDTYCGYTTEKTLTVDVGALGSTTGVSSVSGANALVDGQSYTVRFNYTDEAGNVATESTINITYSSTTTTLTISKVAVDAGNPLDGNQAWQPVMCYKAETNTNTSTISSFKITKLGSNADTDFETDAVTLFESDDATLDTGSDTNLGAKAFATNWTWNSGFHSVGSGTDDKYYFFCVDVKSGFNETHTIGSRVGDGDVASNADQTVNDPSGNLDSESKYLDGYTSIVGGDYGDASITPGTNDNPFFTFHIKSNQGSTTMSQVVIALSGSVVSGDFPTGAFQLYKDTDSNFDGATAIGSSLDFGSTLTFSSLGQTITTTDTYYFLTCDVSSGADDTHNIKATLTASDSNPTTGYANILDADAGDISGGTHTLPVELSSFNITNTGRKVILAWTTQTETENQGFNIFRGISENDIENSQAMKLNKLLIPGAINSTQPTDYMFYDDKRIEYGTTYFYWIQTVDLGGYTEFSDPVSYKPLAPTDSHDIPGLLTYGLHTNYPNPFNPETTISFVLDKSSEVTLDIYNIKGQKIKSLYHDNATSGKLYKIVWNGKNDQNRNVASGVYFYRLKTAYSQYQKSMLLLK